jgi:hypothetical protein
MKTSFVAEHQGYVSRTNGGILLLFTNGADKWQGPWPEMSWDTLYDKYIPQYTKLPPECKEVPAIILGPCTDYCRGPIIGGNYGEFQYLMSTGQHERAAQLIIKRECYNLTNYQHCSFECWYLSEQQALKDDIQYAHSHRQNATAAVNKLLKFEAVFKRFVNRWVQYHQQWTT